MPTYKVKIEAEAEIEAENVAQAYRAIRERLRIHAGLPTASAWSRFLAEPSRGRHGKLNVVCLGKVTITNFGRPVRINPTSTDPLVTDGKIELDINARINNESRKLASKQDPLGGEFQDVLNKHLWDLYEE